MAWRSSPPAWTISGGLCRWRTRSRTRCTSAASSTSPRSCRSWGGERGRSSPSSGASKGASTQLTAGSLRELADHSVELPYQRHDQGGWSQARYQRHVEKLEKDHLRNVAEELDRHVRRLRGPRVVIVCSDEARAELSGLLPKDVRAAVVGWTAAEAHATPAELLAVVSPFSRRLWSGRSERPSSAGARRPGATAARSPAGNGRSRRLRTGASRFSCIRTAPSDPRGGVPSAAGRR